MIYAEASQDDCQDERSFDGIWRLGKMPMYIKVQSLTVFEEKDAALKDAEEKQEVDSAAFPTSLPLVPMEPIMA
eukprot:493178-Amphidinium_carterae.1